MLCGKLATFGGRATAAECSIYRCNRHFIAVTCTFGAARFLAQGGCSGYFQNK